MDERDMRPGTGSTGPSRPDASSEVPRQGPSGDDADFSDFYREFVPVLVAFLRSLGAQLPDAADIAQVTMIKVYGSWSTIESPRAWARKVAYRELTRRTARAEEELVAEAPEHGTLLPPSMDIEEWEDQHGILRALDLLPPRQRQVMAWTLEGYKPSEIADELKITAKAVRESLMQARRALVHGWGNDD